MKRVPNFPLPKWKLKNTKVAEQHWRAISQAGDGHAEDLQIPVC